MNFMMGCYASVMGTGGSGWGGEAEFSKYDTPPTKGVSPDADDMHSGTGLAAKNKKYGDDCVQLFDEGGLDPDDDEDNGGYTKRRMGGGGGGGGQQQHHHQHQKSSPPKGQGSSVNNTHSSNMHFQQRQVQQLQGRQSRKVDEEVDEVLMFEEQIRDKHLHMHVHGNGAADKAAGADVTPSKVMTAEAWLKSRALGVGGGTDHGKNTYNTGSGSLGSVVVGKGSPAMRGGGLTASNGDMADGVHAFDAMSTKENDRNGKGSSGGGGAAMGTGGGGGSSGTHGHGRQNIASLHAMELMDL